MSEISGIELMAYDLLKMRVVTHSPLIAQYWLLCTMYIPRPARLLFTVDDGWNRYLKKHGDGVSL